MKLLATVVALTLVLAPTASANANTLAYVSGIVVTEDNQPVAFSGVSFREKRSNSLGPVTFTSTDKDGRFLLQLPIGNYRVGLESYFKSGKSRCINGVFDYSVAETKNDLQITTPRFRDYGVEFLEAQSGLPVWSVSTQLSNIKYKSVESPGIGKVDFYCTQGIPPTISAKWLAFEVDAEGSPGDRSSYQYASGIGQSVTTKLGPANWNSGNLVFSIPNLPSVKIQKSSVKVSNGRLQGVATFIESTDLKQFQLDRKFRLTYRVNNGKRVTGWITKKPTFLLDSNNKVAFKLSVSFYKGTTIEFMVTGDNFSLGTNVLKVSVPK